MKFDIEKCSGIPMVGKGRGKTNEENYDFEIIRNIMKTASTV